MQCPLCQGRQARRVCPAVGRQICPVCCGTKRQVEIACPADCGYLAAAHSHPPASVRRQQERDVGFLVAMREGLSNRESELFWVILTFLAGMKADPLLRLVDEDVAEAAGALAATYETANRGLIYEHRPQSLASQRLVNDLKAFLGTLLQGADAATTRNVERDVAVVLRHLEKGAREVRRFVDEGPATALAIITRVVTAARGSHQEPPEGEPRVEPPAPLLIRP
jgi:hypothetical protein